MILAIDTATRWTGLALRDDNQVVAEQGWLSTRTQSMELAPAVSAMLQRAALGTGDLMAVAVAIGPGSYTGLRIGLGLAKGMALAHQMPLVGVPTLDIIAASQVPAEGELVVVVEAGRHRITTGRYGWQKKGWEALETPHNETWEELLARLAPPVTLAGEISRAGQKLIRGAGRGYRVASPAARVRRAAVLAEIGWFRLRRGRIDDPATLTPLYLRDP